MSRAKKNLTATPLPLSEEIVKQVKECLSASGVEPEAFDIIPSPYCLVAPSLASSADQYFPCYVAVSKINGMAFFFPALGEHGLYTRCRNKGLVH